MVAPTFTNTNPEVMRANHFVAREFYKTQEMRIHQRYSMLGYLTSNPCTASKPIISPTILYWLTSKAPSCITNFSHVAKREVAVQTDRSDDGCSEDHPG